jgi:hypothetical protein
MAPGKSLLVLAGFIAVAKPCAFGQQRLHKVGDVAKGTVIEKPVSNFLVLNTTDASSSAKEFVNPKVQPGHVHWHPSFESACEAARKSGKPVLLFQMMGKLDDQFC